MKINKFVKRIFMIAVMLMGAASAHAALSTSYVFNGNGNWSLDACGSNSTNPVCTINAVVPSGSTVEAAFLYSSLIPDASLTSVTLDGTTYSGAAWTSLGSNDVGLQAYRADVTAQIAAAVGGGSASPYTFTVQSENPNSLVDGEVLAIIYSNPAESTRTIAFLDGFSATTGDATNVNLADPLTAAQLADPSFEAMLSLGIGYGYQTVGDSSQSSIVSVNGTTITTCAGGQDDGISANGGLITVGGYGDSTNAATCDNSGPRQDDELYSLTPNLAAGDTTIQINTSNPSHDDNIFFAGINITAVAGVNEPPPSSVPEPGSIALLGLGLLGLGFIGRKKAA